MATWDEILTFYREAAPFLREGEMWDKMNYHCLRVQALISEIQKHPDLSELDHRISVVELSLSNSAKRRQALIFVESDDTVRINFNDWDKLKNLGASFTVHASFDDIIQVLKTHLLNSETNNPAPSPNT